jgi:hypothetical protein
MSADALALACFTLLFNFTVDPSKNPQLFLALALTSVLSGY